MDATAAGSCCCSCEAMPGDLSMIFTANAGTDVFPACCCIFWNGEKRTTAVSVGGQHRRHVCVDRARGIHGDGLEVVLTLDGAEWDSRLGLHLISRCCCFWADLQSVVSRPSSQTLSEQRLGLDAGRKGPAVDREWCSSLVPQTRHGAVRS